MYCVRESGNDASSSNDSSFFGCSNHSSSVTYLVIWTLLSIKNPRKATEITTLKIVTVFPMLGFSQNDRSLEEVAIIASIAETFK